MIAMHDSEATFQTRQMKVINPAEIAIQEIETKHHEFQQACKSRSQANWRSFAPTRGFFCTLYVTTYGNIEQADIASCRLCRTP